MKREIGETKMLFNQQERRLMRLHQHGLTTIVGGVLLMRLSNYHFLRECSRCGLIKTIYNGLFSPSTGNKTE